MSDFIASNGMTVSPHTNPAIPLIIKNGNEIFSLSRLEAEAVREYFQHERDQEVGRWRWPEDPDIVVYPERKGSVFCFDEATGEGAFGKRGSFEEGSYWDHVARDYFETHPEKKEWHSAGPGEVWVITVDGEELLCRSNSDGDFTPVFGHHHWVTISNGSRAITAGRRIWPEGGDDQ